MKLTKEQIGIEKISPSQLGTYEECPRLYYYRDWLKLQLTQDKLHLDYGNAIHSAIHIIFLEYDTNFGGGWSAGNFKNVLYSFDQHWRQEHVPVLSYEKVMSTKFGREMGFRSPKQLYEYMRADGIKILESYWKEKDRLLMEHGHDLINFETPMKIPIINPANPNERLPVMLSMRIDAETRDLKKGVDFKTSKGKYDEDESRKKIQGQCYCFARGYREFDYIVLRKDLKSDDRIEVVSLKYDDADMQAFYHRVEAILVGIANRHFDRPNKGHANWCDCLKYEEALSVKGIDLPRLGSAVAA